MTQKVGDKVVYMRDGKELEATVTDVHPNDVLSLETKEGNVKSKYSRVAKGEANMNWKPSAGNLPAQPPAPLRPSNELPNPPPTRPDNSLPGTAAPKTAEQRQAERGPEGDAIGSDT